MTKVHLSDAILDHAREWIVFTGKALLEIYRLFSLHAFVSPPSKVGEVRCAFISKNPLHRDVGVVERLSYSLEGPQVVSIGRDMCAALELEADLAEVECKLVEGVLESWHLLSFVRIVVQREYESR